MDIDEEPKPRAGANQKVDELGTVLFGKLHHGLHLEDDLRIALESARRCQRLPIRWMVWFFVHFVYFVVEIVWIHPGEADDFRRSDFSSSVWVSVHLWLQLLSFLRPPYIAFHARFAAHESPRGVA
jgi:hypothetical protein